MEDDWESAAHRPVVVIPDKINKWAGEDEEDDIKDSWEDEEEKKDEEKVEEQPKAPVKTKPSKALKAKLAEQERLAEEEEAKRIANMTPEEKLAEKLRLQKIQEESDLKSALETFGVQDVGGGLDAFNPKTEAEFKEFGATLSWKLSQYKESPHFPQFVEDLVRSICVNLPLTELKKLKMSVETLHSEKVKLEKQNAKKPASKTKGKITLKNDSNDIDTFKKYGNDYSTYDDYDDFM
ncbi:eukaryotic translation initiation factor 3 subunit J-like [Musca domestica]|uniref:Eukaryotic translation initiation factor 3 subunit J n=1 Tax=Musca domestica TaxID=7370 RepID=T1PCW3_MUSDO|nr:eukaryotic translation initiation factor 3 subunit J [Musca domestica]XP_058981908.1 eukaryotic translation initiation factor 3 subunit J-like [Musca domestica]